MVAWYAHSRNRFIRYLNQGSPQPHPITHHRHRVESHELEEGIALQVKLAHSQANGALNPVVSNLAPESQDETPSCAPGPRR